MLTKKQGFINIQYPKNFVNLSICKFEIPIVHNSLLDKTLPDTIIDWNNLLWISSSIQEINNFFQSRFILKLTFMEFYQKDLELGWLWATFHNEQVRLLPLIDKTQSNESNRTYLRSFFSMIEGITYRTRQNLLERQRDKKINLIPEQVIALSEISIELEKNGTFKTSPRFYDVRSMMLFTYRTYCELYNKQDIYNRFLSDNRFNDFNASIKMRNRITHPKSGGDVYINGNDIQTIMSAGEWFHEFTFEIFMGDLINQE